jgi:hypothetical protein
MATTERPTPLATASDENDAAWLLNLIWDRMNERNEHFVGVFVGREGSGKSLTAIKVAEMLDPRFEADENIFFKLDNFLEVLAEEEYTPGDVYVLDEAGVQLGNRTWQDRAQVLANQALQLIRDHNVGLIFTLPRLSELDKQARGRLQLMFEIIGKNPDQHVTVQPKRLEPDRSGTTGKVYKKYPKREAAMAATGIGAQRKVTRIKLTPPDGDIIGTYQRRKSVFQDERYEEAIAELRGENTDEDNVNEPQAIADNIQENGGAEQYLKEINNGAQVVLDWRRIKSEYEVGAPRAKEVKSILKEREGIDAI